MLAYEGLVRKSWSSFFFFSKKCFFFLACHCQESILRSWRNTRGLRALTFEAVPMLDDFSWGQWMGRTWKGLISKNCQVCQVPALLDQIQLQAVNQHTANFSRPIHYWKRPWVPNSFALKMCLKLVLFCHRKHGASVSNAPPLDLPLKLYRKATSRRLIWAVLEWCEWCQLRGWRETLRHSGINCKSERY